MSRCNINCGMSNKIKTPKISLLIEILLFLIYQEILSKNSEILKIKISNPNFKRKKTPTNPNKTSIPLIVREKAIPVFAPKFKAEKTPAWNVSKLPKRAGKGTKEDRL